MHLRRSFTTAPYAAAAAAAALWLGLGTPVVLAQTPPPPPPVSFGTVPAPAPASAPAPAAGDAAPAGGEPVRFTADVHGGLIFRVGDLPVQQPARGGGLVGLDLLLGPNKWWALGVGYDHAFIGSERVSGTAGAFTDTSRSLDELWALGRFYPWQNDSVALYLQLGLGPTWQSVNFSGDVSSTGLDGSVMLAPTQCTGRGAVGLGLRGGAGVDVTLSSLIIFYGEVGVDHFRTSSDQVGSCAPGMGPATFLATRVGFAFATGRIKPPPPPAPPPAPSDRDGDAILDNVDACPDQAGLPSTDPTKNGCPPPPDRDHDGIPDDVDACPDHAGPPSDDPKKNGCPDKDGDKIIDALDACPDRPGVPSDDPKKNGCPPDTDGDGIPDDIDACPNEAGPANADPAKNGCPLVVVRDKEIVITQQVQFEVDKSVIKKESGELLDFIARVLKDHPEIAKVEVQGHTDNTGKAAHNKTLSASRADAVKRALVQRGVADKRLVAKGYGQEKPIADNDGDVGRAKNRRVQFVILEKKAPPAPGDAPPPPTKPKPTKPQPPPPPKKQ
jgi:outer membrane protein OmpA-like peptidoglycan-associated protein